MLELIVCFREVPPVFPFSSFRCMLIPLAFIYLETNNNVGAEKMFQTPTGSIPIITRNRVFESSSYDSQSRPMSADQALIAASFPTATSSPTLVEQTHLLNLAQQNTKLVYLSYLICILFNKD